MNRTTLGYFLMAVIAAGVLWGILKVGSRLQAPPNWAGKWQVAEPALPPREAEIAQSGLYFHVRLGDEPARPYKLERQSETYVLAGNGESRRAEFERGDTWTTLKLTDPTGQSPTIRLIRETKPATKNDAR